MERCGRVVALALVLGLAHQCAATTSVRVAMPDLAGMLYPQQTQGRVATFSSAAVPSSLVPFYGQQLTTDETVPPCDAAAALCLDVAWASQYQFDPFVLTAFESKYVVGSTTFDGVSIASGTTAGVLPVIEGDQSNTSTHPTGFLQYRTLWRFHAPRGIDENGTIDVLFRLRQQSQLRAARDQLLLHVVASQQAANTNRAVVETYTVYGNQRVAHAVAHVSQRQIRVDVDIMRDTTHADVLLPDAYPLVPIERATQSMGSKWALVDEECRRCTAQLLGCESVDDLDTDACTFETSTAEIPVCLRTLQGLSTDWIQGFISGAVGESHTMTPSFWTCLNSVYARESAGNYELPPKQSSSWTFTSALSCLAARLCPFGPLGGGLSSPTVPAKMLQLTEPKPFIFQLEWPTSRELLGYFSMTVGGGPNFEPAYSITAASVTNASSATDVESVFRSLLSGLDGVAVSATMGNTSTSTRVDIVFTGIPIYFWINFEDTAPDMMGYSVTPVNQDGGTTALRVAEMNSSLLTFKNDCDRCESELEACRADDTCRLIVLPCVEKELDKVTPANATINAEYGTYQVDLLPALFSMCFANVSIASWNPVRRTLVCLSRYQCRLDSMNTTSEDEQTFFRLRNGSQVIAAPIDMAQAGEAVVDLQISSPWGSFHFHTTVTSLATFVRLFVLQNAAEVFVEIQEYAANTSFVQLELTYVNTLLPWTPSFTGSSNGVVVLQNMSAAGALDFADSTTLSIDRLRELARRCQNLLVDGDDLAVASRHSWNLAPECLACSASLYGCSAGDVQTNACLYDNGTSQLAQCIRQAIPRQRIASLVNTTPTADGAAPSWIIGTDVTRCIRTSSTLNATLSQVAGIRALSCFVRTQCPFGPVDLVQTNRMVQLTTSTFLQSLRIPARQYRVVLDVAIGARTIAMVNLTESNNATRLLTESLEPYGITARVESSYSDPEWTVEISYGNVVTSDFNVQIAASSVPSPMMIEQASLRPTTRLVVSPRRVSKVFKESEVNNNSSADTSDSGSSDASSAGSTHGADESPPPDPTSDNGWPLLQFSSDCFACDDIHLTACRRSNYCRTIVGPCFISQLSQSSFENLAQTMPDGTTSVDLAPILRSCVTPDSFFDWWEPIQRWLGCYASARCPITRADASRTSDSFLEFTPPSVTINTTIPDMWQSEAGDFFVTVPSSGSSTSGRSFSADGTWKLEDLSELGSQGTSKATVTTSPRTDEPGTSIHVNYDGPFFGSPVTPSNHDTPVSDWTTVEARLLVRATTNTMPMSPWAGLVDKLSSLQGYVGPPGSCSDCATMYLEACRNMPNCNGYFLECLSTSVTEEYSSLSNSDRNVYNAIAGCSRDMPNADWWPVIKYLTCLRDHQCIVSDATSPPTYIRVQSAFMRMEVNRNNLAAIQITLNGTTQTTSSLAQFRYILETLIGNAGTVDMRLRDLEGSSSTRVEIFLRDFLGSVPHVAYGGQPVTSIDPAVVMYSLGDIDTSSITSAITGIMVVPQCTAICYEHLERCARGDSYDSLQCRYQLLPCAAKLITEDIRNGAGVRSSDGRSVNITADLRSCLPSPSYYKPLQPIAQYFGCLARSGCTLNTPRSNSAKTELRFQPAGQTLFASGSYVIGMTPPQGLGDTVAQTFSALSSDYLRWRLQSSIMKSVANVTVETTELSDASRRLVIDYSDYLGELPFVSGGDAAVISQSVGSVTIASSTSIDGSQWSRLQDALTTFSADKSATCPACLANNIFNCQVCSSTVIPSLLLMLSASAVADTPSFNLTDLFYTCVDTLLPSEWIPVAKTLKCLMENGCPASSDSGSTRPPNAETSFLMLTPARFTLTLPASMPQTATFVFGRAPNHSMDASSETEQPVEIVIDKDNGYTSFKTGISSMMIKDGQSPTVQIKEQYLEPDSDHLVLDVEIRDYFGWLPRFVSTTAGSGVASQVSTLPLFVAQTFGNISGASVAGLVSSLEGYASPDTTPIRVYSGGCASNCAPQLYDCDPDAVAYGQCRYTTSNSQFITCLRRTLPPSVFYGVGRVQDATYIINTALAKCFGVVQDLDEVAGASDFKSDLWYAVSNALTCFELQSCTFGPFNEAMAHGNMIMLQSTSVTRSFVIASATFTATFRSSFGFRVIESTAFTETTTDEELMNLLSAILPPADLSASMSQDASACTVYVTIKSVFFPDFGLSLQAGTATVVDTTPNASSILALRSVPLDTTDLPLTP